MSTIVPTGLFDPSRMLHERSTRDRCSNIRGSVPLSEGFMSEPISFGLCQCCESTYALFARAKPVVINVCHTLWRTIEKIYQIGKYYLTQGFSMIHFVQSRPDSLIPEIYSPQVVYDNSRSESKIKQLWRNLMCCCSYPNLKARVQAENTELSRDIRILTERVASVQKFVDTHPEFAQLAAEPWDQFVRQHYMELPPGLEGLDLSDPINQSYDLSRKKAGLQKILDNYEYFLRLHPNILSAFLSQQSQ